MKAVSLLIIAAGAWIIWFGSPFADELPRKEHYYGSPEPILPMTFAHADHSGINCARCHHNFVDGTGSGPCMTCHVTRDELWPVLEQQFHGLCRGCHTDKSALGEKSGSPRRCISCHLGDEQS